MASAIDFHRELADDIKTVIGGGWWHLVHAEKKLYLYGTSDEFGPCSEEQVRQSIEQYMSPRLLGYKVYLSSGLTVSDAVFKGSFIGEIM